MKLFVLAALCIALPLTGCVIGGNNSDSQINDQSQPINAQSQPAPTDLIATDFVNALRQLQSVPADSTTVDLQLSQNNDPFTNAVKEALQQAGYGIRWIENEGTSKLFQYRLVSDDAAGSVKRNTYELAVGEVEMRREYATDNRNRVQPVSPLYVRGVDASGIVLNDDIFDNATPSLASNSPETTVQSDEEALSVDVNAVPLKPLATISNTTPPGTLALQNTSPLQVPSDANPLDPIVAGAASSGQLSLPLVALPTVENVFELGGSNFDDLLSGHSVLTEQVLTFANDSMRLGDRNKRLLEQLVEERFQPETDIISVIGCSMGPTQVRGGNAALALGRAGRVVEALKFAGVADPNILDEGCWAGEGSLHNLPRRGVVVTLNRRL